MHASLNFLVNVHFGQLHKQRNHRSLAFLVQFFAKPIESATERQYYRQGFVFIHAALLFCVQAMAEVAHTTPAILTPVTTTPPLWCQITRCSSTADVSRKEHKQDFHNLTWHIQHFMHILESAPQFFKLRSLYWLRYRDWERCSDAINDNG